ncbi:MAG TPA: glycerate-2-kinase family protein, partial [Chitinophagaceae bacterium]|nr:glycerate-2-kinase family protein [Chitinophagaceae bacterium]
MSRSDVIEIFNAAVAAVHPRNIIPAVLRLQNGAIEIANETIQLSPGRKVFLLSVGKAASAMALEAEKILYNSIAAGLVVTKYHHSLPLQFCTTIEAAHPVPDENSVKAAYSIKHFLRQLRKDDLLLCFISGGASALIGDWKESMTLEDAKQITQLLLQCGATIHELNTLRKHLCFLKGGQLLEHCNGAAVYSFIMSDVPGDDFSIIASGLTVADASTAEDALRVLQKYE